jgi:hypothetical protein
MLCNYTRDFAALLDTYAFCYTTKVNVSMQGFQRLALLYASIESSHYHLCDGPICFHTVHCATIPLLRWSQASEVPLLLLHMCPLQPAARVRSSGSPG